MANDWWDEAIKIAIASAASAVTQEVVTRSFAVFFDDSPGDQSPSKSLEPDLTLSKSRERLDSARYHERIDALLLELSLMRLHISLTGDKQLPDGRVVFRDGDLSYEGDLRNGKPHGRGIFKDAYKCYVGEWRYGKPEGRGVYAREGDVHYAGEWIAGERFAYPGSP